MVEILTEFAQSAPIFYLFCSLVLSTTFSLLFIPSLPITTVNVIVYGPIWGGVISFVGELIAAYVTYDLYKWGYRHSAAKISRIRNMLESRPEMHNRNGFLQILFLRLLPFFPSSGATVYALIRKIGRNPYMWATAIGKCPAIAIEVLGSIGIVWLFSDQLNLVLIAMFVLLMLYYCVKRMIQHLRQNSLNQDEPYHHD